MKFDIRINGRNVTVEAESVVQAVTKIIDIWSGTTDNMEFQIIEYINDNCCLSVCQK